MLEHKVTDDEIEGAIGEWQRLIRLDHNGFIRAGVLQYGLVHVAGNDFCNLAPQSHKRFFVGAFTFR